MATYKLNRKAEADLRKIYRYGFFEHGERLADQYYAAFFKRFAQARGQPA